MVLLFHGIYYSLFPFPHPQRPPPGSVPCSGDRSRLPAMDGCTHRQMVCSRLEVLPQTDALFQENNVISGWKEGCPSWCLQTEVASCSVKAVTWCQFIVPRTESLPGDEVQRKLEVAGALEGSKRSLMEGFGKSCLTNLFFYVWLLAGSPENSFLIISLTEK